MHAISCVRCYCPDYIPRYKLWKGLVAPMWLVIRFCTWISDVTLVTSQVMKVSHEALHHLPPGPHQDPATLVKNMICLLQMITAKCAL